MKLRYWGVHVNSYVCFFSRDSEAWLCILHLALTAQPSVENIPLHACPWRWTSCSICRGSLHMSRGERLFFCNRLMHAFRLNNIYIYIYIYIKLPSTRKLPLHHRDEPLISGHPWLLRLTLTGDRYCLRLHFPRSWCIIKHEFLAVTHALSGRFRC